jgi:hypothetical protein
LLPSSFHVNSYAVDKGGVLAVDVSGVLADVDGGVLVDGFRWAVEGSFLGLLVESLFPFYVSCLSSSLAGVCGEIK